MYHRLFILALAIGCGPLAVLLFALLALTAAMHLICMVTRTALRIRAHLCCPQPTRVLVNAAHAAGNATPHGGDMRHDHRFQQIHEELRQHWRCGSDTRELTRLIRTLQAEVAVEQAEIAELLRRVPAPDTTPTHVTVTVKGNIMSFAPGTTITFTAVSDNDKGVAVPDTYTWTATAGTIVPGVDSSVITISDAPVGDVTATATDTLGLAGSATATVAEVVDETPASVTVTVS